MKIENTHTHAYEQLFRDNYSDMCAYANRFLNDVAASEDVVQEVFVKLWNNKEDVSQLRSQRSYLFRAVRNSCLNLIKHIQIREDYKQDNERQMTLDEGHDGDGELISELEQKIRKTIDRLPIERRKVFIMSRYDGLKYREIADKLGISQKTVEKQIGSALRFLRQELKEYLPVIVLFFKDFFNEIMKNQ